MVYFTIQRRMDGNIPVQVTAIFLLGSESKVILGGSDSKESACKAGDQGSIPGSGRSTREGNDYPLLYSFLENSKDRGAWQATFIYFIYNVKCKMS